ncbi:MAG: hypothetical protein H6577_22500 [Lewinellaceae bacterium]|nr:hypothetical protein [Saprospiraceae bacterium]MCB9340907.1 hypothetical protein [Lewinellaceae bacterium]
MKNTCIALFSLLPVFLFSQTPPADTIFEHWHHEDKMAPTANEILLKIEVFDFNMKKIPALPVSAVQLESGRVWHGQTGSNGEVYFLVPKGKGYRFDAGKEQGLKQVRLPNAGYMRSSYGITYVADSYTETEKNDTVVQTVPSSQSPTRSKVLVKLKVSDFDDKPLEEEALYFTAQKTGKTYLAVSSPDGKASLMLPKGDTFCLSTRFVQHIECFGLKDDDFAQTLTLRYRTLGTKAILAREAERLRQAAIRDSLYRLERARDSIRFVRDSLGGMFSEQNFLHQLGFGGDAGEVEKQIRQRAEKERELIANDPQYFEKAGDEIKAVLFRMRSPWAKKVIVTDITGSMYPYMDQILLWHALQLVQGEDNRYLFFNDGDSQPEEDKLIGSAGGIYPTDAGDMRQLMETMVASMKAGGGGASPENDLEATLAGVKKLRGTDELILIADNYSDVRDMELLARLKVPVHIILAGSGAGVNEDYLEIAYKTGGSVHTLTQDIEDLAKLADGQTITIGDYQYRVSKGKFLQVSKG